MNQQKEQSPELPFDDDAKCQSAAHKHLPNAGLPEVLAYALGVHTHARPLAHAIWRMAKEADRINHFPSRWDDAGAISVADEIIAIAEEMGIPLSDK